MACVIGRNFDTFMRDCLLQCYGGNPIGRCFSLRGSVNKQATVFLFVFSEVSADFAVVLEHVGDHSLGGHGGKYGPAVLVEFGEVGQPSTVV